MQKIKLLLYTGLTLLTIGIILRFSMGPGLIPSILIYSGVALKVSYLLYIIFKGRFKPGIEILFLLVGLSLVFSGSRLRGFDVNPYLITSMIVTGATLKLLFIIFLFRKLKQRSNKS